MIISSIISDRVIFLIRGIFKKYRACGRKKKQLLILKFKTLIPFKIVSLERLLDSGFRIVSNHTVAFAMMCSLDSNRVFSAHRMISITSRMILDVTTELTKAYDYIDIHMYLSYKLLSTPLINQQVSRY